jgi:cytochrome b involved in lipid metabolism
LFSISSNFLLDFEFKLPKKIILITEMSNQALN